MKVVFTVDYNEKKFEQIKALGYELEYISENKIDEPNFPYDADVLVCFRALDYLDLDKFTNLKYIMLISIGFDFVPQDKIIEKGITLINNKGGYSIPMGEFIVFNMLQLAKKDHVFSEQQRNKVWKQRLSFGELFGKTVVFLGTGTIAQEGAKRLQGFGMNIIGMNTNGRSVGLFEEAYALSDYKTAFPKADYLVCVLPATGSTTHFLNEETLSHLPKGANFVNVSRGAVVDEAALIKLLQDGHIGGAAVDVFEVEPLPEDSPLWDMEQVYVFPHSSGTSDAVIDRRLEMMYNNLKRIKDGEKPMNIVDIAKGY